MGTRLQSIDIVIKYEYRKKHYVLSDISHQCFALEKIFSVIWQRESAVASSARLHVHCK